MTKFTEEDFKNGQVVLIDKPLEWTSFQVVNKLRWHIKKHFKINKIKVGHAGTLDPLATGLLIICTGKQTKKIHEYQGQVKKYIGTFTLGATTPSYDLETKINKTFSTQHITEELLKKTTKQFTGVIQQIPPIFSAIKKKGKRLYKLARKGETIKINPREITIFEFKIIKIDLPKIEFQIICSKGTYIRSIAYDFGVALNSGAYLSSLRRIRIGDYSIKNALKIKEFLKLLEEK